MMTVDLDLTHFIKETQLQHGLRAEDYARYHAYISNRLATLRKQVHLSNDRKKFLNKQVTPANATDQKHLMLLALYAERCWSEAEAIVDTRQSYSAAARGEGSSKPKGGIPPRDLAGKRLNKAVKWAEKLRAVAAAVGAPRLQGECEAYFLETSGRCAAAHSRFANARQHFVAARGAYYDLRGASTEEQWAVVQLKINELDDRVVFCMQQVGEDPASYAPPAVAARGDGNSAAEGAAGTTLRWNGRTLNVSSIKVKDAHREAQGVPVESAIEKVLEVGGTVPVGQVNKIVDLMGRRISLYDDALAHASQDLRAAVDGSAAKVELQLIVHYLRFNVSKETLRRFLFLAEAHARRFHATERVMQQRGQRRPPGAKKSQITPAQFASPLEVARLYDAAAEPVNEMELLPGVSGRADVEEMSAVVKAGKLVYTGESWRIVGETGSADKCYRAAIAILADTGAMPEARQLRDFAEAASLQMGAENVLSSSTSTAAAAALVYLTDATREQVAVAQNVVRFPPDFQAAPCKPAFVDIASTYVDFPFDDMPAVEPQSAAAKQPGKSSQKQQRSAGDSKGSPWDWSWSS